MLAPTQVYPVYLLLFSCSSQDVKNQKHETLFKSKQGILQLPI